MEVGELSVVADRGYFSGRELLDCERVGIKTHDRYRCPAGEYLTRHFRSVEAGMTMFVYFAPDPTCRGCSMRARCTTRPTARRIRRWELFHAGP